MEIWEVFSLDIPYKFPKDMSHPDTDKHRQKSSGDKLEEEVGEGGGGGGVGTRSSGVLRRSWS
jgi:hypothetical protein